MIVTESDRTSYENDGVVCLRGVYTSEAITTLLETWDKVAADPHASGLVPPHEEHREVGDRANIISRPSHAIEGFRNFVSNSPIPSLLGELLDTSEIGFYWDTIFSKDAGSTWPTNWHHDAGATAIQGNRCVNAWTPLTPVTHESSLECLAGSHKRDVLYWPRSPNSSRMLQPPDRPYCPDFDTFRGQPGYRFLTWEMEPGDVLILHLKTAHYSRGNPTADPRVAYATWWYGDDVVWDPRPECEAGHPEAPFSKMPPGEKPNHPLFPIMWRKTEC